MPSTCLLGCKMLLSYDNSKYISYVNFTEGSRSWDLTKKKHFCKNINALK